MYAHLQIRCHVAVWLPYHVLPRHVRVVLQAAGGGPVVGSHSCSRASREGMWELVLSNIQEGQLLKVELAGTALDCSSEGEKRGVRRWGLRSSYPSAA